MSYAARMPKNDRLLWARDCEKICGNLHSPRLSRRDVNNGRISSRGVYPSSREIWKKTEQLAETILNLTLFTTQTAVAYGVK